MHQASPQTGRCRGSWRARKAEKRVGSHRTSFEETETRMGMTAAISPTTLPSEGAVKVTGVDSAHQAAAPGLCNQDPFWWDEERLLLRIQTAGCSRFLAVMLSLLADVWKDTALYAGVGGTTRPRWSICCRMPVCFRSAREARCRRLHRRLLVVWLRYTFIPGTLQDPSGSPSGAP